MKTMNEEFEGVFTEYESKHLTGASGLVRKVAQHFYEARQPEIDALNAELRMLRDGIQTMGDALADGVWAHLISSDDDLNALDVGISSVVGKLTTLRAENERLRKAAEETLSCFYSSARYSQGFESSCERLRAALEGK